MKFLIRDDDTCGITRVEELRRCYEAVWKHIPVCLSVTPHRIPSKVDWIPEEYYGCDKSVPLGDNKELVAFLKAGLENKWLDIALHGFHHIATSTSSQGKPFDSSDIRHLGREYLYGDGLEEKTRKGKEYLEGLLAYRLNTFVPPGNAISKEGLNAIIEQKMNLIGSPRLGLFSFKQRPFNPFDYINAAKRKLWRMKQEHHTKYPFILDFKNHKEIAFYLLYPSTDLIELKKEIDFVHSVNGTFILSTHYHAFQKKIKSGETIEYAFKEILDYIAKKDGVDFITYRELWR